MFITFWRHDQWQNRGEDCTFLGCPCSYIDKSIRQGIGLMQRSHFQDWVLIFAYFKIHICSELIKIVRMYIIQLCVLNLPYETHTKRKWEWIPKEADCGIQKRQVVTKLCMLYRQTAVRHSLSNITSCKFWYPFSFAFIMSSAQKFLNM